MSGRTGPLLLTAVNIAAALVSVACVAYMVGFQDAQRDRAPSRSGAGIVSPNPHVGHGQHPTFDCSIMAKAVDAEEDGLVDIGQLSEGRDDFEEKVITVRAVVVQAFPQIMGTNWFHLCDRPNGDVLVVSSSEWVEPGNVVDIRGALSVDRNIGGAYVFPLFIEDADLDGENVQPAAATRPIGTYDL